MNSNYNPKTKKFYCECGCGEEVSDPSYSFKTGHRNKTEEGRECISKAYAGLIHSEETRRHMSKGQRQAYIDDPTLADRISETITGSVKSKEEIQKVREGQRRFLDSEEGQKYIEDISGEGSPHWRGGHSHRYGYGWSAIRVCILSRDYYTCQGCGSKLNPLVHHIDSNPDNADDTNLITVCHLCNMKATSKYEGNYWFDFYTNRIKEIYV